MSKWETITDPSLLPADGKRLLEYWYSCCDDYVVPTRKIWTPHNLKRWLGRISVYWVRNDGEDFLIALDGTDIVRITGRDWTGKSARDVDRAYDANLHDDLLECRNSMNPLIHYMPVWQNEYKHVYRILFPISKNGTEIDQIFLCLFDRPLTAANSC